MLTRSTASTSWVNGLRAALAERTRGLTGLRTPEELQLAGRMTGLLYLRRAPPAGGHVLGPPPPDDRRVRDRRGADDDDRRRAVAGALLPLLHRRLRGLLLPPAPGDPALPRLGAP